MAVKKKEILPFATTWIKLEDIMLNNINKSERETQTLYGLTYFFFLWSHFYVESKKAKLIEPDNRMMVTRG